MLFQKPLKLFIAYAHEDKSFKNELTKRLKPLKQKNEIKVWHDSKLVLGYKYPEVIDRHLKNADVVLYLVSSDSLASDACNKEIAKALDNQKRFVPIILRKSDWKRHKVSESSIADFPALPKDGKPIDSWESKDKAWQNVIDGIRKVLDSVKEKEDTFQSTLFELGKAKYMLGALDEALASYTKAIELEPNLAEAYNSRGILFSKLKQYDKAEADYTKAIKLKTDDAEAYSNRGNLFGDLKQYDKAEADYTKAIELEPDFAGAYNNRGLLLRELKQYDKAEEDLNKAIELEPDIPEAYANRGILFYELKQYDKAEADYTKAIELKPDLPEAYANRGILFYELKQYDKAEADYTKAIELEYDFARAYNGRGVLFGDLKQYDKAEADFTKAIELEPDNAGAYANRGDLFSAFEQYDKAEADYTKAIELKPDFAGAYYNRGNLLRELQRYNEAVADIKKAKKLSQQEGNQEGVIICERWLNEDMPSSDSSIKPLKGRGSLLTGRNKSKEERILEVMHDLNHSLKGCETQSSANSEQVDNTQRLVGALARTCSIFLRKMVIGDRGNKKTRLLNDEILQSLGLKFSKIIKIQKKRKPLDALNLSSYGGSMIFKKINETTGLPESSYDSPISPMEYKISIDWPLPGVANWTENPTKENMWCIQEKELFDTQNNDIFDCDQWLGQQLVIFDDKGITLKEIIKTVANYEGAHASNVFRLSQPESDKSNYSPANRPELHILNNIKFFGIKYSHIIVIESALYLYEKLIKNDLCKSMRDSAYKATLCFASPSPENTFLEYSKWLRYDGGIILPLGNEKNIISHRIRAVS